MMHIRFATEEDAPALLEIYRQYIDTSITFEYELPSVEEFARRIHDFGSFYPYFVCEEDGKILGYAYAHRQAERAAYQWNAELSLYLDKDCTGKGVGHRMYTVLLELLRLQGIRTVYALVTSPNTPSEWLNYSMGFHLMGVQKNIGYKAGAWHGVSWFEKAIGDYDEHPQPPQSIHDVPQEQVQEIMERF